MQRGPRGRGARRPDEPRRDVLRQLVAAALVPQRRLPARCVRLDAGVGSDRKGHAVGRRRRRRVRAAFARRPLATPLRPHAVLQAQVSSY